MKHRLIDADGPSTYIVNLEAGDEVAASLNRFSQEKKLELLCRYAVDCKPCPWELACRLWNVHAGCRFSWKSEVNGLHSEGGRLAV
jgi:hypothetical protein